MSYSASDFVNDCAENAVAYDLPAVDAADLADCDETDELRLLAEQVARAMSKAALVDDLAAALRKAAWFIENVAEDSLGRAEKFFECRELWRNALAKVQS